MPEGGALLPQVPLRARRQRTGALRPLHLRKGPRLLALGTLQSGGGLRLPRRGRQPPEGRRRCPGQPRAAHSPGLARGPPRPGLAPGPTPPTPRPHAAPEPGGGSRQRRKGGERGGRGRDAARGERQRAREGHEGDAAGQGEKNGARGKDAAGRGGERGRGRGRERGSRGHRKRSGKHGERGGPPRGREHDTGDAADRGRLPGELPRVGTPARARGGGGQRRARGRGGGLPRVRTPARAGKPLPTQPPHSDGPSTGPGCAGPPAHAGHRRRPGAAHPGPPPRGNSRAGGTGDARTTGAPRARSRSRRGHLPDHTGGAVPRRPGGGPQTPHRPRPSRQGAEATRTPARPRRAHRAPPTRGRLRTPGRPRSSLQEATTTRQPAQPHRQRHAPEGAPAAAASATDCKGPEAATPAPARRPPTAGWRTAPAARPGWATGTAGSPRPKP